MNEQVRQLQQAGVKHLFFPGTDVFSAPQRRPWQKKQPTGNNSTPAHEAPACHQERELHPKLRAQIKRVPILWTYFEFPRDLFEKGNPQRRELVRGIMTALKARESWPAGSSTFWPLSGVDENGRLFPDPELFWNGVRRITPLYVFCLGPRAVQTLSPEQEFSLQPFSCGGLRIQPLPSLQWMLEGPVEQQKDCKNQAWEILKGYTRYVR
ncbi:MAG: hypothetical protein ACLFSY_05055 [Desulfonatronovibrionaceae bacterium]